jgi:hypothetical protein
MSERILKLMDIRELLIHIRAGASYRQIQRDTGFDRRTVKRYREWAQQQGLLEGELPGLEELHGMVERGFKTNRQQKASAARSSNGQRRGWKWQPCGSG